MAGRDPASIRTHVRVHVSAGTPVEQVGDAVKSLWDSDDRGALVDMRYAVDGTDAQLERVARLLAVGV